MIVKQIRLSQQEKDKLIKIKSRTGIQNWNILCRWAFCWSIAQPTVPGEVDPPSDSNVEMSWQTFGGEYDEIYEAVLRQRCMEDGLGSSPEVLYRYFRLHLYRGINYFSMPGKEKTNRIFLQELTKSDKDMREEEV